MKRHVTVQVFDRSQVIKQEEFQQKSDELMNKEGFHYTQSIQWLLYSFSDILLSSFSPLPFYPCQYPQKQYSLSSTEYYTCACKLVMSDKIVDEEMVCIDFQERTVLEEVKMEEEDVEKKNEEEQVEMIGDSVLLVVNGTRMLLSKEEYLQEKEKQQRQAKKSKKSKDEENEEELLCFVDATQSFSSLYLPSIMHNPMYFLHSPSSVFIQLNRSLVLQKQYLIVSIDAYQFTFLPVTTTTAILIALEPTAMIPMSIKKDCSSFFDHNNNELFFYEHDMNMSNSISLLYSEIEKEGSSNPVLPFDLVNCAFIRKLRVSTAKGKEESIQQEEEFITSLREKLQAGSVREILNN